MGVPNLHKVDDVLYRSAQPTASGMKELKKVGIKTVVNLRSFHSDRDEIGDTELGYEHLYMKAWHPERKEAVRFLQLVTDPERVPVLVHCQHGADRTGTLCAIYRIVIQKWTKEEAIREMTEGGFGFHEVWINLPDWIDDLDAETLEKEFREERTPTNAL
jgi:protein tyrosine/serine phosphatase